MSAEIKAWPKAGGEVADLPKPLMYPAEFGLLNKVRDLEFQMGTVAAYNALVAAAAGLRAKIDAGKAEPQAPLAIGYAKPKPGWVR